MIQLKDKSYAIWNPLVNYALDKVYDVDNIYFDDGLIVILVPNDIDHSKRSKNKLKLHWPSFDSFNVNQESHRQSLWINDTEEPWSFYRTSNSDYIEFIKKDSILFLKENIIHFLILGTNLIIDALSRYEPTIELVE